MSDWHPISLTSALQLIAIFKRQADDLLAERRRDDEPVLTSPQARTACWRKPRVNLLQGIARDEHAMKQGRTLPPTQAMAHMARWLKQSNAASTFNSVARQLPA